jgi:UDP-3-O-[3-hydroxymyristoyl] glucosamine N-acyltransferase
MADPRFYEALGPLTAADVAQLVAGRVLSGDPAVRLKALAGLETGGIGDLTFLDRVPRTGFRASTAASACLVPPGAAEGMPQGVTVIEAVSPRALLGAVAARLVRLRLPDPSVPGVHPLALLEDGVTVMPGALVCAGAEIGSGTVVGPNVVIGPGVAIGRDCHISAGAVIQCALIGDRVRIGANCVIGEAGFGVAPTPAGPVVIQDDVTLGALTAVDRAAFGETVVGLGSKIDNFVHVGHNVRLGRGVLIAAFGGLSGTTEIGDFVMMGGRVGVGDHLAVGDRAVLAAGSAVLSDVPAGETWQGYPAQPALRWRREQVLLRRMTEPKKKP